MKDLVPYQELPIWALMITPLMFALFIGVIYWVSRRSRVGLYQKLGDLPLRDDQ